jgi:hypothetical protein
VVAVMAGENGGREVLRIGVVASVLAMLCFNLLTAAHLHPPRRSENYGPLI